MEVSQMKSITRAARTRCYLSRHERQLQARAEAFSRRTTTMPPAAPPTVRLEPDDLALIDRLVRQDRTAVSSALLVIAGIGAGEAARRAVLASVAEAACWAHAAGAISSNRATQIARHVNRATRLAEVPVAA
jgi:hypothetical protein